MSTRFFDHRDQQCWTVTFGCVQKPDDGKVGGGENEFKLQMCASPGGGWFIRFNGEVALEFDELKRLENELQIVADMLNWGKP